MTPGRLVISCPDRPGIVAAVSTFLAQSGANIVHADQHTTHEDGQFFMRVEYENVDSASLSDRFRPVADSFGMEYRFVPGEQRKRIAIFVSKEDHCLQELLWHVRAGDIPAEVAFVAGNHRDLEPIALQFNVPFHHIPVLSGQKGEAEAKQAELCRSVDAIVLAKYMQILSAEFLREWSNRVVNIHHSFLPAFMGARPYHQAHVRGVKLIGATAHYVTGELDAGPIIEQDVQRVDHRADPIELRRLGRQVERAVLARAVKWHVEDRVLVHGNRTVVFA